MVRKGSRKKKKKSGMLITIDAARKLRGGFGIPRIPTGLGARAASAIKPYAEAALRAAADEARDFGLEYATAAMTGAKVPNVIDAGTRVLGRMKGLANDLASGTTGENSFSQTNGTKNRYLGGALPTKEYFTTLETGRPSTRQMRQLARMNGFKRAEFYNSEYNAKTDAPTRAPLRIETGFNQKNIVALGLANWTTAELRNIYSTTGLNTASNKRENIYVQTMSLYRQIRIMNTNSFLAANVCLRLWRSNYGGGNVSIDMGNNECFASDVSLSQRVGCLPLQYQFTDPFAAGQGMDRVIVDPVVSPHHSPGWKERWEEVRSLRKKLKPGEIWNVKEEFQCGAGINLDLLKEFADEHPQSCAGYQWTLEVHGVRCQGIVGAQTNVHIIGTAPCFIQTEILRGHQTVFAASTQGTNFELVAGGGGLDDDRYAVRAFTKRATALNADKKTNFLPIKVKGAPTTVGGEIYIPVMAETAISYAQEAGED